MKLKKLEWETFSGGMLLARIDGFDSNYAIYFCHHDLTWKVSGIDRKKTNHSGSEEAKEWCQQDFDNKIKALYES